MPISNLKIHIQLMEMDDELSQEIEELENYDEAVLKKESTKTDFSKSRKTDLIHFLPCEIDHNGFAPVSTFFESLIEKDSGNLSKTKEIYKSSFRGKLFKGVLVDQKLQIMNLCKAKDTEASSKVSKSIFEDNRYLVSDISTEKNFYKWEFDSNPTEYSCLADIKKTLEKLRVLS